MDLHLFLLFIACMMLATAGFRALQDSLERPIEIGAGICLIVGTVGAVLVLAIAISGLFLP